MRRLMLAALLLGLAAGSVWLVLRDGPGERGSTASDREEPSDATVGAVLVGRAVEGADQPDPDAPAAPPLMKTLSGAVVYPDDTPAPGVEVVIRALHEAGGAEHRVTTDAAGRFEARVVSKASYRAYAPNRSGAQTWWAGGGSVRLVARVPSRSDVRLRILGPDGTPVPRVEVGYGPGNASFMHYIEVEGGIVSLAGESGDEVHISEPRDATGRRLNMLPAWRRLSDDGETVVRLEPGRRLDGVVRDADGTPLPRVDLRIESRGLPLGGVHTETDAKGRFTSIGVGSPDGHVKLHIAAHDGYLPVRDRWIPPGTSHVEVELARGRDLRVLVLDPEGKPAEGVYVGGRSIWKARRVTCDDHTDAEGRATLCGLPAGRPVDVKTGAKDAWPGMWFRDLTPVDAEIVLHLEAGVTLIGDVRGADGRTIHWARVSARGLDDRTQGTSYQTDTEGARSSFRLGPLLPGRYRVSARVQEPYADPAPIDVDAPAEDLVIVAPKAVTLEGSFVGKGLVRPQIRFFSTAGEAGDVRSVQGGAFRLTGLRNEPGILYAYEEKTDRCWIRYDVRPSEGPFEIRLEEGHRVAGRLEGFDRHTSPWTGVTLYSGLFRLNSSAARDGTFVFHAVPPGTYEIRLWPNDHERVVHQGIEAGATDLVFPMPPERNAR